MRIAKVSICGFTPTDANIGGCGTGRTEAKRRWLGVYPKIGLKDAREAAAAARKMLDQGIDPAVRRKLDKMAEAKLAENTFQVIAEEWLAKVAREGRAEGTMIRARRLVRKAFPLLGSRPIAEIEAPELLAVLRKVEAKGRYETAKRLRATCGQVFRYAIATGRAGRDPSADLRGALIAPTPRHRAAITKPEDIGALMRVIEGYDGQPETRLALRLLALTFVRPGELRFAEWVEF